MTPQVVLSCLGSWTLVCNVVFAHFLLKEYINKTQRFAVVGLVVSTAMVVCNAPPPSAHEQANDWSLEDLVARFCSIEFEILTLTLFLVGCFIRMMAYGLSCTGDVESAQSSSETKETLVATSYAMAAACAGGYTALLFKCVSEIIAGVALRPDAQTSPWECWQTYAILGVALCCAPTELHCLNLALQNGDAVFVVPTYLTLGMLAQLTTGAVFFQELQEFQSVSKEIGFAVSVALSLVSVIVMAKAQSSKALREPKLPELQVDLDPEVIQYVANLDSDHTIRAHSTNSIDSSSRTKRVRPRTLTVAGFGGAMEAFPQIKRCDSAYF
jgi:hypothetical protein